MEKIKPTCHPGRRAFNPERNNEYARSNSAWPAAV